jgi:demethylmenaquinone methyltransferase/2-methoxy-6-polyprenyl-1,4-benzoquinol methylase
MFDAIAPRYDLLNFLLSGGLHRVWEKRLVRSLPVLERGVCLDLCTGTGALVPYLAPRYQQVCGVDISSQMLNRARQRFREISNVTWMEGDAQALSFDDGSFDVVTVAYGVRNWPERERGLREVCRVLRVGGYVGILEFGQPRNALWRALFSLYSRYVIPTIGGLLSGSRAAYEYLPKTSAVFPCGGAFEELLTSEGLTPLSTVPLAGGVAYVYVAVKRA